MSEDLVEAIGKKLLEVAGHKGKAKKQTFLDIADGLVENETNAQRIVLLRFAQQIISILHERELFTGRVVARLYSWLGPDRMLLSIQMKRGRLNFRYEDGRLVRDVVNHGKGVLRTYDVEGNLIAGKDIVRTKGGFAGVRGEMIISLRKIVDAASPELRRELADGVDKVFDYLDVLRTEPDHPDRFLRVCKSFHEILNLFDESLSAVYDDDEDAS